MLCINNFILVLGMKLETRGIPLAEGLCCREGFDFCEVKKKFEVREDSPSKLEAVGMIITSLGLSGDDSHGKTSVQTGTRDPCEQGTADLC